MAGHQHLVVFKMQQIDIFKKVLSDGVCFTMLDSQEAIKLGFLERDAIILNDIGLPSFVAPNMWFSGASLYKDGFIMIGEDRDNRKIIYEIAKGHLYVESSDKLLLMACSLYDLLEILYMYAVMIDKSLEESGCNAATDNLIPDHLILEFEEFVKAKFRDHKVIDNFWVEEITRRKSHVPDEVMFNWQANYSLSLEDGKIILAADKDILISIADNMVQLALGQLSGDCLFRKEDANPLNNLELIVRKS